MINTDKVGEAVCLEDIHKEADEKISVLGDHCIVSVDETEICENIGRISSIDNLDRCVNLKSLILTAQHISRIEGLTHNVRLEQLELYQNQIRRIENLETLVELKILDLSFNRIRVIENLDSLVQLKELYLTSNKIGKIENLEKLTQLKQLELGSNRIRVVENLENATQLTALWLGKNKITQLTLPKLPCLEILSLQSNRLTLWNDSLFSCSYMLKELYLSHNALSDIPAEIATLTNLRVLDLAGNRIVSLENLSKCLSLEELWLNDNQIKGIKNIEHLVPLKNLETLYLERNPIQTDTGPGYTQTILSQLHWLKQLDALCVSSVYSVVSTSK